VSNQPEHVAVARPHPSPTTCRINEAAEILRADIDTLRYWRHLGIGPRSFKIGRRIFYWRGEVHRWLREQEAADTRIHKH
jgi:hypothetical protein